MALRITFMNISPFRRSLISRLRPYDITKLVVALGCDLTKAKRKLYLDIVDDIFPDRSELNKL